MAFDLNDDLDKGAELRKLGETIRRVRLRRGLSQSELGHRINKDQQSIQRLESGRVNPSYFYLLEIARGLEVGIGELLD